MMLPGRSERLLDALARTVPMPEGDDHPQVLVVGAAGAAGLLAGLHALYPAAALTVIDGEQAALDSLADAAEGADFSGVRGSAGDLPDLAPGPYALAIVRHPDVAAARGGWEVALEASIGVLHENGVLVATSPVLPDAAFVDSVARASGMTMVPGTPYTAVPVGITDEDRYILIYTSG